MSKKRNIKNDSERLKLKNKCSFITKPENMKELIIRIVVGILFFAVLGGLVIYANYDSDMFTINKYEATEFEPIKVLKIVEDTTEPNEKYEDTLVGKQVMNIQILSGRHKGNKMQITFFSSPLNYNIIAKEGDILYARIYSEIDENGKEDVTVEIFSHSRLPILIGLMILFAVLLVIIGGRKGLMALLGLIYTIISIFFVLVPLLLKGWYAIPTTILLLTISTVACFYLLGGFNTKTVCATLGTLSGVLIAASLSAIAGNLCHISGNNMEEAESLYLYADSYINVKGLFIAGILIASVGAIMDVAMSIASSIDELHTVNPEMTSFQLFKSGMNIGRDAMGTMANTLILAFAGSYLNIVMYIYQISQPLKSVFNDSNISIEIIKGFSGSIGIISTVPLVALISSILTVRKKVKKK